MKFYHGTTKNNLWNILHNNQSNKSNSIWSCSANDDYLYLWGKKSLLENYDNEDLKDKNFVKESLIIQAFESAELQALADINCDKLVVIEFDIPKSALELVRNDESVDINNGAECIDIDDIDFNWIKSIKEVDHNIYDNIKNYLSLSHNNYFNNYHVDEKIIDFCEKVSDNLELYYETVYDYEENSFPEFLENNCSFLKKYDDKKYSQLIDFLKENKNKKDWKFLNNMLDTEIKKRTLVDKAELLNLINREEEKPTNKNNNKNKNII